MIIFLFWYTFDDWLAKTTGIEWLGTVPLMLAFLGDIFVWIAVALLFVAFGTKFRFKLEG